MFEASLQFSPQVDKPSPDTTACLPAVKKERIAWKRTARILPLKWDDQAHEYRVLIGTHAKGTVKKGKPGFPGGGPNPGERLTRAVRREMREETGLRLGKKLDTQRYKVRIEDRRVELTYFIGFLHPKDDWKLVGNMLPDHPERHEFTGARYVLPIELERDDLPFMMEADIVMWQTFAKPRIEALSRLRVLTALNV